MFASYSQQAPQTNFSRSPSQQHLRPTDAYHLPITGSLNNTVVCQAPNAQGLTSSQVIPAKLKTLTKLERLLQQKDIFETLRKINCGQIRSYYDLPLVAGDGKSAKV
jgi:hypothetical protein